jgi:hypothetical protein
MTESRIERANRLLAGEVLDDDPPAPPARPRPAPRPAPRPVARPAAPSTAMVLASRGATQKPSQTPGKRPPALLEHPPAGLRGRGRASEDEEEDDEDEDEDEDQGDLEGEFDEGDGDEDDDPDADEDDDPDADPDDDDDPEADPEANLAHGASVAPEDRGEGITISDTLVLPDSTVTESIGIVAQRGSGKTYLTTVLAEEMSLGGLPFVVLDPMGVYWGLRSSSDGTAPGRPVYILGGDHGDLPLDPAGGRAIARWVLAHRQPAVLDLSNFRRADQRLFVGDFAEELFENCKDPLHVIVDEADLFIPQKPLPEDKRCLAAFEDIVRRGRSRGLGTTVVTQRPAVINKDILTQIGTLVVLRMTGPQDLDAIKEWVRSHGDLTRQRLMLASLPSLPIGTAWFWSPGWLGVLKRVQVRKKYTWDSSVTPKVGEPRPVPEERADVDIDVLREAVSKATDSDPNSVTSLKTRIKELERALNEKEGSGTTVTKLQSRIAELEHRLMARPASPRANVDGEAIVTQVNALTKAVVDLVKEVRKDKKKG